MDIPTFNGRLHYSSYLSDSQILLDWLQSMDMYFIRYQLSEFEKVRFATINLIRQANQYWPNFVNRRVLNGQQPIETCDRMNEELEAKYVPPYFYEFRPPPFVQPRRSNTLSFPPIKLTPSSQTMESQPTLDDIMAKIDKLLQIMNSSYKNSKSSVPYVIPTVGEVKKKSDNNKSKNIEKDFFKISLTIKCYKCQRL